MSCPNNMLYDKGFCFPPCNPGFKGDGQTCWPECPANWTDTGTACAKISYNRGAGTMPINCPAGSTKNGNSCFNPNQNQIFAPTICEGGKVNDNGLCYIPCNPNYTGVGPVCWTNCPLNNFKDNGAFCTKIEQKRGIGIAANPIIQPINPTIQPINPINQTVNPTIQPINPTIQPINPTIQPINPTIQPINPTNQPINPTNQPINPTNQSLNPTNQSGNATNQNNNYHGIPVAPPSNKTDFPSISEILYYGAIIMLIIIIFSVLFRTVLMYIGIVLLVIFIIYMYKYINNNKHPPIGQRA